MSKKANGTQFNPADAMNNASEMFRNAGENFTSAFGDTQKMMNERIVEMSKATLDLAHANVEDGFKAARAALEAKDVKEAMEIQSDYVRTVSERTMSESKKFMELASTSMKDTVEPFTSAMTKAQKSVA